MTPPLGLHGLKDPSRQFRVGAATDIGRKRSQNQDSISSRAELGLFVVADGMGGHRGGETASAMAVIAIPEVVEHAQADPHWEPRLVIAHAIRKANENIYTRSQTDPALQGMGTTSVALLFKDNTLTIGHVGDSRAYFIRDGGIWQITRDHSLVQEKLRAGIISRAEVKTDRMKNVITRSVGFELVVNVEVYEMETRPGDRFLICSDGLSGLIDDQKILEIVSKTQDNPQHSVQDLIAAANANGGDDNISTIVVEILEK
jgi:serine/threonine protein phosphatase PrpC